MENKIDITKTYRTRDGGEVRIFTTDGRSSFYPVSGELKRGESWHNAQWTERGKFFSSGPESDTDIIEVLPEIKLEGWLNAWDSGNYTIHKTKEEADLMAYNNRIPCINLSDLNITFKHGDGL